VEVAVVVEAGERVGLRLQLERLADLRVVERERGRVAEALRELEVLLGEAGVLAEPVDVERALDRVPGDEGNGDERFGLVRRSARNDLNPRVEVGLVHEQRLAMLHGPAGDALPEDGTVVHDLVRPRVPGHQGDEAPPRFVRLVDGEGVVWNEVSERVGDAVEK
jgi:hypothetical protein